MIYVSLIKSHEKITPCSSFHNLIFYFPSPFFYSVHCKRSTLKGAIIIANLEGQVTVKNNDTGVSPCLRIV